MKTKLPIQDNWQLKGSEIPGATNGIILSSLTKRTEL